MASTPASRLLSKEKLAGWVPHFQDLSNHVPKFNTLTASVQSLQKELSSGRLQSTEIVEEFQRSACLYNEWLGAVYQLAPGALDRARELDSMRQNGNVLGPLHGVPILVKDNIATPKGLGMGTTGGAVALIGSEPDGAPIVDRLLEAGAIIYGKATLSELGYFKGKNIRCGWSATAGQSQSAYVRGGLDWSDSIGGHSNPLGSSSGCAIAVSAGLAPIAVGTETDGSLVSPSTRASLYTVKPTHGLVDTTNIIPTSARYDTAGPMGKTVKDVADLLNVLVDHSKTEVPQGDYASAITTTWDDIKVGTLDPEKWRMNDTFVKPVPEATKQILELTRAAYGRIQGLAKSYYENLPLRPLADFKFEGRNATQTLMVADLKGDMDTYLGSLKQSKVKSLRELVEWNKTHAEEALTDEYPNQILLEQGLEFGDSAEAREKPLAHAKAVAASFEEMIEKYDIDVIIAPGDCTLSTYAAAGEFPIASLPMSYLDFNGRPVGLLVAAPRHKESVLIKVMSAWEATFSPRKEPSEFLKHPTVA
ncbi:hypothetical protein MMC31_007615 [Peltigera leucophlebia]|nr:hypothetical protein [Peltigera leucophlebia]